MEYHSLSSSLMKDRRTETDRSADGQSSIDKVCMRIGYP